MVGKNAQGKLIEGTHSEGRNYMSHNGAWHDAGTDALAAQRRRSALLDLEEFKASAGNGFIIGGKAARYGCREHRFRDNCANKTTILRKRLEQQLTLLISKKG